MADRHLRTRKINAIIEPVGYTMRKRNIIKIESSETASSSSTTPATKTKVNAKSLINPNNRIAAGKKPAAKITKDEEEGSESSSVQDAKRTEGEEEQEDAGQYSPATQAIMQAMAGSDVTPDEDTSSDDENEVDDGDVA